MSEYFIRSYATFILFLIASLLFMRCCRNTKWGFLEGVKSSGAAPPRHVLVQQCIRDKGLLETLCNYVCISITRCMNLGIVN